MHQNSALKTEETFFGNMNNPYKDTKDGSMKIRTFKAGVDSSELVWHRDKQNRKVTILEGEGWSLQMDNEIPKQLKVGDVIEINKMEYHRIYESGSSDLVISIEEYPFKSFKDYISEASKAGKNTHMTHIEDRVLYAGVKGAREAILALRSLRDMLAGKTNSSTNVTVKWDGAPAVFAGTDPSDGRFFVAKKGIFNKSPKVYKNDADIDADTSGDLNTKLKLALQYLPDLGITGVIQGDFLFSSADVKTQKIKGSTYVTFHPNTILYAVPANTDMAKEVKSAKIGIVWHTTYSGKTFESLKASFSGVDVSKFKKSKNVWSQDAMLRDMTSLTMTKKDTDEVNGY